MKNRLTKFFLHLFIRYVPSANQLAGDEAKRLASYVYDNFSEEERVLILAKMKDCLVEFTEAQIEVKKAYLDSKFKELENLKQTLSKLQK